ncbi:MAG: hypothetical protein A2666_01315 [Parcubacteria group bacterium RIFCSPHIGHO2_01_FULL_47_10b]|nr:MAG: hypothetical protein A2666_01315 [Parcubacteria group bacterium RIFCSPHIGHO2_01_FULL_47_10b]
MTIPTVLQQQRTLVRVEVKTATEAPRTEVVDIATQLEFNGINDDVVQRKHGFFDVFSLAEYVANNKLHEAFEVHRPTLPHSESMSERFAIAFERVFTGLGYSIFTLLIFYALWFSSSGASLSAAESLSIIVLSHLLTAGWSRIILAEAHVHGHAESIRYERVFAKPYWLAVSAILVVSILVGSFSPSLGFIFVHIALFWLVVSYYAAIRQIPNALLLLGSISISGYGLSQTSLNPLAYDPIVLLSGFTIISQIYFLWRQRFVAPIIVYRGKYEMETVYQNPIFLFGIGYGFLIFGDLVVAALTGNLSNLVSGDGNYLLYKYGGLLPLLISGGFIEWSIHSFFKKANEIEKKERHSHRCMENLRGVYRSLMLRFVSLHIVIFGLLVVGVIVFKPTLLDGTIMHVSNIALISLPSSLSIMVGLMALCNTTILYNMGAKEIATHALYKSIVVGGGVGIAFSLGGSPMLLGWSLLAAASVFALITFMSAFQLLTRMSFLRYVQSIN